ncbi:hypothetical protein [Streptomyces sp. NPDC051677]
MNDHDGLKPGEDDGFEDVVVTDEDPAVDEHRLSSRAADGPDFI